MADAYLNEHVSVKAALNAALADAVQHLPSVGADEAQDELKETCAKLIYDAKLSRTNKDFVRHKAPDAWPAIHTAKNPYGLKKVCARTCEQRSCVLRQVHKKLATEQPLYIDSDDGPPVQSYAWLEDTDAVLAAAALAYPKYQGFNTAIQSLCQLCEALGEGRLKQQYYHLGMQRLQKMQKPEPTTTDKALTPEELRLVQSTMHELREQALAAPIETKRQCANNYLVLAFRYGDGDGDGFYAPQRNDFPSFQFVSESTDRATANYITLPDDATQPCTLTMTHANKKQRLDPPMTMPLPTQLSAFLRSHRAFAASQQGRDDPYVVWKLDKRPWDASFLTTNEARFWAGMVDKGRLPPKKHGCNVSRHTAQACFNRRVGLKRKTRSLQAMEAEFARRMLHSVRVGETCYGV